MKNCDTVSSSLEDYEVLSILGADLNSTCYKVKNRTTSQIFVWKAISVANFSEPEKQSLLAQIEKQKSLSHPHLLQVYDYILHEKIKVLYLVCEFCANGNLTSIVHRCLLENEYLSESFLWRTLYQIACALKTGDNLTSGITLNNVFLTDDYEVKLFNSTLNKEQQKFHTSSENMSFGSVVFELCTLQLQQHQIKNNVTLIKQFLSEIPSYYSNEFKEIVNFMLLTNSDQKTMVNAILCHPTILLKASQPKQDNIFVKGPLKKPKVPTKSATLENVSNTELSTVYQTRLENLKNRETALRVQKERLASKEHELHKREKRVALMERTVREKLVHAELYLKRCREYKSSSSGSNRSTAPKPRTENYENFDTSVPAHCGDSSVIIPTSKKLVPDIMKRTPSFIWTTERKVRFKGHSPLKDMFSWNACKETRTLQQCSQLRMIDEIASVTASEKSSEGNISKLNVTSDKLPEKKSKSRKKLDLFSGLPLKNRKPLVERNVQISKERETVMANQENLFRPISWTEESKQHAFDLLRIMNQGEENEPIKHTYL